MAEELPSEFDLIVIGTGESYNHQQMAKTIDFIEFGKFSSNRFD